ncbi:hypothetical protein ASPZODRAFT_14607 [Penicilliopsis zonata CBS 506.65]|uniref:2Fe-2S ferredoxin-type domain-containing protein n=1 Tax=Penicilliopsis zonata CBS 506.65 TaxID=1073090 RepID=A0A1L9SMQ0_9EURO|nr:hypothetical protein ASPZODRAFT_14607 [Penicilliopsis zonata CBS 506.65]OJJ48468.1 hypothetical protein ASPZODRAFT_14607 [Penicilliopsis zonata CBS 506.65]
MSFFREAIQPVRRAVSSTLAMDRSGALQTRRCLSHSTRVRVVQSTESRFMQSRNGRNSGIWRELNANQSWCSRRSFSATAGASHGHITPPKPGEEINISFIDKDGEKWDFQVAEGDNLLDIAQANDLEMEGACGGSCACSTCHVIVEDPDLFDKMEEPSDDENDMLDLAFGLTETSRLGCQVIMTKDLDGMVVRLPSMTRNLQASDFVEKKR